MNGDFTGDEKTFVDSNIWLYALIAQQDSEKSKRAQQVTNGLLHIINPFE